VPAALRAALIRLLFIEIRFLQSFRRCFIIYNVQSLASGRICFFECPRELHPMLIQPTSIGRERFQEIEA